MATAHLTLDDVGDSIHTHDLQIENIGKSTENLELFYILSNKKDE